MLGVMSVEHREPAPSADQVDALRRFNRFYTRRIGPLERGLLASPYTLTQMRVLYELGHASDEGDQDARRLGADLGLDAGYLSRILAGFEADGMLTRRVDAADRRRRRLALTRKGRAALARWERKSSAQSAALLAPMAAGDRAWLVAALERVEGLMSGAAPGAVRLRAHRAGDVAWAVSSQARHYAREYGWNAEYEALASEIGARFLREFDAARERCWIAERDGRRVGAVFLMTRSDDEAQLRLLHVEPEARGAGAGRMLVGECVTSARALGYRRISLWTNSVLVAARRLYQSFGFELVDEAAHHSFGHDLLGQTWRLDL